MFRKKCDGTVTVDLYAEGPVIQLDLYLDLAKIANKKTIKLKVVDSTNYNLIFEAPENTTE